MPNIRVTCPTCKTQLEIDSIHEGAEVECGHCFQVFVATAKSSGGAGADRSAESGGRIRGSASRSSPRSRDDDDDDDDREYRGRRRRRDDDDDDDDYGPIRRRSGGSNGLAIASLVLGIVTFVPGCCCGYFSLPLALGAITTGVLGMNKSSGKGMAIAGVVLGTVWIAFVLLILIVDVGLNLKNPGRFR